MTHLDTITPLVGIIAAERTKDRPDLFDDARQEGLIRAWSVTTKRPDAPREYLVACAKRGVVDVLRGRPAFGAESHRGKAEPLDSAVSISVDEDTEETLALLADGVASLALDTAEIALARAEVRAAVAALDVDDREIVFARFWLGQTWPEIAVDRGKRTEAVRRRFVDHIAPVLVERLAHLRGLA